MTIPTPARSESGPLGLDLNDRPVRGSDILFLQQWFGLTLTETCYMLGLSLPKWQACIQHPDEPVNDPTVALLVWLLATYPETRFLPQFPEPAEVLPQYLATAQQSTKTLGDVRRTRFGKTAFGLLLGREITSSNRWMSEHHPRQPSPQVHRLLFVFRNLLLTHGVPGFDTWVERVEQEATARGLKLSTRMTSWSRMLAASAAQPARERRRSRKKPKPEESAG